MKTPQVSSLLAAACIIALFWTVCPVEGQTVAELTECTQRLSTDAQNSFTATQLCSAIKRYISCVFAILEPPPSEATIDFWAAILNDALDYDGFLQTCTIDYRDLAGLPAKTLSSRDLAVLECQTTFHLAVEGMGMERHGKEVCAHVDQFIECLERELGVSAPTAHLMETIAHSSISAANVLLNCNLEEPYDKMPTQTGCYSDFTVDIVPYVKDLAHPKICDVVEKYLRCLFKESPNLLTTSNVDAFGEAYDKEIAEQFPGIQCNLDYKDIAGLSGEAHLTKQSMTVIVTCGALLWLLA